MPDDQYKAVRIENIDEIADLAHRCTAQDVLTKIQVEQARFSENLIHLSVCFEQVAAQLQEQNKNILAFVETSSERICLLETSIGKHDCKKETMLINMAADITNIKMELSAYKGESKWVDRAMNIIQAVLIAVIVLLATFFMKGGAIT